jgi:hypothetical protein
MEPEILQITEFLGFADQFLHVILTEIPLTCGVSLTDRVAWHQLRHGNEPDGRRLSSGSLGRARDTSPYDTQIFRNGAHRGLKKGSF